MTLYYEKKVTINDLKMNQKVENVKEILLKFERSKRNAILKAKLNVEINITYKDKITYRQYR